MKTPHEITKYPELIQRMWMHVYESVKLKEINEERAINAANSVVKKNFSKFGPSRYGHNAHINYQIDRFLGNLKG